MNFSLLLSIYVMLFGYFIVYLLCYFIYYIY